MLQGLISRDRVYNTKISEMDKTTYLSVQRPLFYYIFLIGKMVHHL